MQVAQGTVVAGGPGYGGCRRPEVRWLQAARGTVVAGGLRYGGCRDNEKYALRTFHCRSMQKALQAVPAALSYLFAS